MKTRLLKRLLITFSAVITISIGILFACADGDWGWFGYSNFAPEPYADKSYSPLFYSSSEMFYGIGHDDEYTSRFNDEIKNDWSGFLENKLSSAQINFFLLNDSSKSDVEGLFNYISKNAKNESFNRWNSKLNLNDPKVKDFIEFLYFAKKIEAYSVNTYNEWDYDKTVEVKRIEPALIAKVQNKYQSATNPFLKNRYWFQTMKAYFYSASKSDIIPFFEKTKAETPINTLYYRALAYVAGAYNQNKDYSKANYLYSVVFDKCIPLRVVTAYNFHPQNETDWKSALDLAKTNDEKSALWALLGYYADTERAISEIFKLNPQSPHLDYLLTRLVNSQEENLQAEIKESTLKYKAQLKNRLSKNAVETVNMIAQSEKTLKPYFWNMAAGYLQTLNGNYSLAKSYFTKCEKQIPATQILKNQLRLLRFINTLSEMDVMNPANENILIPELNWLYSLNSEKEGDLRFEAAVNWSKLYISAIYASKNNVIMAELFHPADGFYKDNAMLDAMKNFLDKPDKTPFEKLAESVYPITLGDIYEYQSVLASYQNQIDLAFEYMGKAGDLKDQLLLGNPFNGNVQDCHDCDHLAAQKTKYSKLRFLEIVKIMQSKIEKGEDLYNNYLLCANAFYNMSYFGNARFFYQTKLIDSWDNFYDKIFMDNSIAKEYYQKALNAAANDEQRAKCTYMLAKCERNEYYKKTDASNDWDYKNHSDFLAWDGFVKLKTKYSATKYYKEVISECGYFEKYVSK